MKENKSKSKKVSKNKKIISKKPTKIIGKKNLKAMPVKPKEVIKKKEKKSRKKLIVLLLLLIGFVSIFSLSSFSSNFLAGNIASSSSLNSSTSVQSSEVKDSSVEARVNTIELVAVEVSKLPNKLEYYSTDNVSTSGGELRLSFSDYSVKYIPMNDKMIDYSRLDLSKVGNSKVMLNVEHNSIKKFVTYDVNVIPFVIKLESIKIDINNADLFVGQKLLLGYSFLPANSYIDQISWSSSNELIASVNSEGLVSAKNQGKVTITLTVNGTISNSTLVNVLPIPQVNAVPVPAPTPPSNNLTLTFDSNGGTVVSTLTIQNGNIASQPSNPTKTGYNFANWYSDSNLQNLFDFSLPINQDTTLYAKWNLITYSIEYNLNGGTNFANPPASYNIETATITLGTPTKSNSTFQGWFTTVTFDVGSDVSTITLGSTGNKIIYAKWETAAIPTISSISLSFSTRTTGVINLSVSNADTYYYVATTSSTVPTATDIRNQGGSYTYKGTDSLTSTNNNINIALDDAYKDYKIYVIASQGTNDSSVSQIKSLSYISIPISTPEELEYLKHNFAAANKTFENGTPGDPSDDIIINFSSTVTDAFHPYKLNYHLLNDIDLSNYSNWAPIGSYYHNVSYVGYKGVFDGRNFSITNVKKTSSTNTSAGLFGYVEGGTIKNLNVEVKFTDVGENNWPSNVGALVGTLRNGTVQNIKTYGYIIGTNQQGYGGIVGDAFDTVNISKSASFVYIKGGTRTGGIVGKTANNASTLNLTISETYFNGYNEGTIAAGLVGNIDKPGSLTIINSYNSGTVYNQNATIGRSSGIFHIAADNVVTTISNVYNIGTITSGSSREGSISTLFNISYLNVTNSEILDTFYLNTSSSPSRGLHQYIVNSVIVDNEFTSTQNIFVESKTSLQLKDQSSYSGWTDFSNYWTIDPNINDGYPYLKNAPSIQQPSTPPAPAT